MENVPGAGVAHELGDQERADAAGAAFEEALVLVLDLDEPADAGADDRAASVAVFLLEVQPGILHRLHRGDEAHLRETVNPVGGPLVEPAARVEVLDLAGDVAGEVRAVEAGDPLDAGLPGEQRVPVGLDVLPDGS